MPKRQGSSTVKLTRKSTKVATPWLIGPSFTIVKIGSPLREREPPVQDGPTSLRAPRGPRLRRRMARTQSETVYLDDHARKAIRGFGQYRPGDIGDDGMAQPQRFKRCRRGCRNGGRAPPNGGAKPPASRRAAKLSASVTSWSSSAAGPGNDTADESKPGVVGERPRSAPPSAYPCRNRTARPPARVAPSCHPSALPPDGQRCSQSLITPRPQEGRRVAQRRDGRDPRAPLDARVRR